MKYRSTLEKSYEPGKFQELMESYNHFKCSYCPKDFGKDPIKLAKHIGKYHNRGRG